MTHPKLHCRVTRSRSFVSLIDYCWQFAACIDSTDTITCHSMTMQVQPHRTENKFLLDGFSFRFSLIILIAWLSIYCTHCFRCCVLLLRFLISSLCQSPERFFSAMGMSTLRLFLGKVPLDIHQYRIRNWFAGCCGGNDYAREVVRVNTPEASKGLGWRVLTWRWLWVLIWGDAEQLSATIVSNYVCNYWACCVLSV